MLPKTRIRGSDDDRVEAEDPPLQKSLAIPLLVAEGQPVSLALWYQN